MVTLRDYQQKAVADIRTAYAQGWRAPLFVLPTGGGKTVLFTFIAQNASSRGKKVLILVHRVELLRQTSKTLRGFGVRHGLINPNYTPDYAASVQVASVQTIVNRLGKMPFAPDLIIIDEAHHATASTWRKVVDAYPKARLLGVTATPVRGDGEGLGVNAGGLFDALIEGPSAAQLMDMGFLVRPTIVVPERVADASAIPKRMGDFVRKDLGAMMMANKVITGDAIDHYRKWCEYVPTVAFCVNVQHSEMIAAAFRDCGYKAFSVDGTTEPAQRERLIKGLGDGSVQILTSCDLIGEGVDIPAIGGEILLRHTDSLSLHLQQMGRALRPCQGKERAVILDHVGNCGINIPSGFVRNLGLPWDERQWSLGGDSRKRRGKKEAEKAEKAVRVSQCPSCFAIHEPAPKCPVCGHVDMKAGGRQLQTQEGELTQITEAQQQAIKFEARKQVGKAQTLEELKELARQRGYKPGWAEHIYNARKQKAG